MSFIYTFPVYRNHQVVNIFDYATTDEAQLWIFPFGSDGLSSLMSQRNATRIVSPY